MRDTKARRVRDPNRAQKIEAAAARLIAERGYASVSIAEIGAKACIVGSGVYRHFDSKAAVLVAIFDRVIDGLIKGQRDAIARAGHDRELVLRAVIDDLIEFVVGERAIAQVYLSEINHMPEADRRRLRRKQRSYVEAWAALLREMRPDLSIGTARAVVHAAIGAIQSTVYHKADLPESALRSLLADCAWRVLRAGV